MRIILAQNSGWRMIPDGDEYEEEREAALAEVQRIYDEQVAPQVASLTNQLADAQQNF